MAMKSGVSLIALAASAAAVLALSPASAQSGAPGQGSATKEELAQNFQAEHAGRPAENTGSEARKQ
jgi:ABC-type glycerol-3-phosphate transport system substrate-binding protein